eukprot:1524980-Amphidinium_carterae.2
MACLVESGDDVAPWAASVGGAVPSTCANWRAESVGAGMTPRLMRSLVRFACRRRRARACKVAVHSEAGKKDAPAAGCGCCIATLTCAHELKSKQAKRLAARLRQVRWDPLLGRAKHADLGLLGTSRTSGRAAAASNDWRALARCEHVLQVHEHAAIKARARAVARTTAEARTKAGARARAITLPGSPVGTHVCKLEHTTCKGKARARAGKKARARASAGAVTLQGPPKC